MSVPDRVDDLGDAARRGHAGGVGAGDAGAPRVPQPLRQRRRPPPAATSPSYGEPNAQLMHGVDRGGPGHARRSAR